MSIRPFATHTMARHAVRLNAPLWPRSTASDAPRRGFALKDAIVVLVIIGLVLGIGFPTVMFIRDKARTMNCQGNLRHIGSAIERFRASDPSATYPIGSGYNLADKSAGVSWWVDVLPHLENADHLPKWSKVPNRGDFAQAEPNPNITWADGYQQSVFFCPASDLPWFNDPQRHISESTRKLLTDRRPQGVAVPMYTPVAGGVPDLRDSQIMQPTDKPHGRNTQDGKWGILSGSGVFPPNARVQQAAIFDQKNRTILIVEQSGWALDTTLEPPDKFDTRSAWPKGAFMGTYGNYKEPRSTHPNLNGDGSERCWNITSVRYPINMHDIKGKKGIVTDPAPPRPAKEGEEPPPPPPYPAQGYGPGHNQPIISAHPGGAHMLFADGSASFMNEAMDLMLLLRMATRDDKVDVADW